MGKQRLGFLIFDSFHLCRTPMPNHGGWPSMVKTLAYSWQASITSALWKFQRNSDLRFGRQGIKSSMGEHFFTEVQLGIRFVNGCLTIPDLRGYTARCELFTYLIGMKERLAPCPLNRFPSILSATHISSAWVLYSGAAGLVSHTRRWGSREPGVLIGRGPSHPH